MSNEVLNGALPAAYAARIFDEAKVPYVLWGHWAVGMFGDDKSFPEVEFIIADAEPNAVTKPLDTAIAALSAKGINRCTNASCQEWTHDRTPPVTEPFTLESPADKEELASIWADNRTHAVGNAHFHLQPPYTFFTVLTLYTQNRLLWWIPRLTVQSVTPTDPIFMLTTNVRLPPRGPGGPSGPWTELYPVRILRLAKLAEALILLILRDGHRPHVPRCWERLWRNLLREKRHTDDGQPTALIVELQETINPRFKVIVEDYVRQPDELAAMNGLSWKKLRKEMIETGEMGQMPSLHPPDVIDRCGKYLP
ncbi:hypothetical protein BDW74DRAFT_177333 [Aspergillus multicolor]|uniref:uncharacterized protein n=1 Tax=Aspergillus multicolor TaxID=41759 RepID=UPI003CCD6806